MTTGGPHSPPSFEHASSAHFMSNLPFSRVYILAAWALLTCLHSQMPTLIHLRGVYESDHSQFLPLAAC